MAETKIDDLGLQKGLGCSFYSSSNTQITSEKVQRPLPFQVRWKRSVWKSPPPWLPQSMSGPKNLQRASETGIPLSGHHRSVALHQVSLTGTAGPSQIREGAVHSASTALSLFYHPLHQPESLSNSSDSYPQQLSVLPYFLNSPLLELKLY